MTNAATINKLIEMRMTPMANAYRDLPEAPGFNDMTFDERIATIVDAEWDARRINKRTRLISQAKFCEENANIADVLYFPDRDLNKAQLSELSNCTWIKERRNVIITGASGAGKSWLACALGMAACNSFYTTKFARLPEMLDELSIKKSEEWLKVKKRYTKCDLLILDDWLLESVSDAGAREILEIIEARNRNGSLILCSQFSASGWHEKLGQGAIADAVIDRIVYNSYTIHIKGEESMRKRMSVLE